jgi:prepilin-type N-terminal cleavage/methylation domain-containing protein
MISRHRIRHGLQNGYTLIEVVLAAAIGLTVMTAMTSVVLTTWRANTVATERVEASNEILSFEQLAHRDFASSAVPANCDSTGVTLNGIRASGATTTVGIPTTIAYSWDGSGVLRRQVDTGTPRQVAGDMTRFNCTTEGVSPYKTVVVSLTVTVGSYSQSQVFRFYPELQG